MSGNGIAISTGAKRDERLPARASGRAARRARAANGSSSAAASATRPNATNDGVAPWSTAILMKRYGIPQRTETAANAAQPAGRQ